MQKMLSKQLMMRSGGGNRNVQRESKEGKVREYFLLGSWRSEMLVLLSLTSECLKTDESKCECQEEINVRGRVIMSQ